MVVLGQRSEKHTACVLFFGSLTHLHGLLLGEDPQGPSCWGGSNRIAVRKCCDLELCHCHLGFQRGVLAQWVQVEAAACSSCRLSRVEGGRWQKSNRWYREELKEVVVQCWLVWMAAGTGDLTSLLEGLAMDLSVLIFMHKMIMCNLECSYRKIIT